MILRKVNMAHPILRVRNDMDRVINDVFGDFLPADPWGVIGMRTFPAINSWEDDQTLYVEAELPGLKMEDIEVCMLGDELTIKGEWKDDREEDVTYHRRERTVGSFNRMLRLPVEVDAKNVQATLRDGVLTVTLPKTQAVLPRKIEVKS